MSKKNRKNQSPLMELINSIHTEVTGDGVNELLASFSDVIVESNQLKNKSTGVLRHELTNFTSYLERIERNMNLLYATSEKLHKLINENEVAQ